MYGAGKYSQDLTHSIQCSHLVAQLLLVSYRVLNELAKETGQELMGKARTALVKAKHTLNVNYFSGYIYNAIQVHTS